MGRCPTTAEIFREPFPELASELARSSAELLDEWYELSSREMPERTTDKQQMQDDLGELLQVIGDMLRHEKALSDVAELARTHGADRWKQRWSASDVVRDYQLMRQVLGFRIQCLPDVDHGRALLAVSVAVDHAISASVESYMSYVVQSERGLQAELRHRVLNALTLAISIARQTIQRAASLKDASTTVEGRLHALAESQRLTATREWEQVSIDDVVRESLKPFDAEPGARIAFEGPQIQLAPRAARSLYLILYELATNATKYGSLSADGGAVSISWTVEEAERNELRLRWVESGGPELSGGKAEEGFGLYMIKALASEVEGKVDVELKRSGACCQLRLPL